MHIPVTRNSVAVSHAIPTPFFESTVVHRIAAVRRATQDIGAREIAATFEL